MFKKNKKTLTLILVILAVATMAVISFQIRDKTGFEPEPVAEEIAPSVVFTIGPVIVTNTVVNTWIMIGILSFASYWIGRSFKIRPTMIQNAIEWLTEVINDLIAKNIGSKNTEMFFPLIASLTIFIGTSNLLGLIPGLRSPTPDINTPIAMALIVFISVPYFGIRTRGLWGYLKHYVEPIFIMLPIEVASEIARTFSLTFRLFGNILGEEIIIAILFLIAPFIVPVPMMLFSIFTGVLQAYIFTLLSCVYIGGAVKAHQTSTK
ncbi:MAG: F0F1 ATP synthase subunit A [Chloroflexota bacterium]|jgi:F-type H+-transporting ATPase subunit a|nr:F0F1 ATP synthase subunit A [Chloroflexota bacterium]